MWAVRLYSMVMRWRANTLAIGAAFGLVACSGRSTSGLVTTEAGADADARCFGCASPQVAPEAGPFVPPPLLPDFCDGGLFVEVSDDAGTSRLTEACGYLGPRAPTIGEYIPADTCLGTELSACE